MEDLLVYLVVLHLQAVDDIGEKALALEHVIVGLFVQTVLADKLPLRIGIDDEGEDNVIEHRKGHRGHCILQDALHHVPDGTGGAPETQVPIYYVLFPAHLLLVLKDCWSSSLVSSPRLRTISEYSFTDMSMSR